MTDDISDALKEWHEQRAKGIFSTDSPVILGLSRRKSLFDLWAEKTGRAEPRAQTLPMWLGLRMQGVVGELAAAKLGAKLRADNRTHFHPDPALHDWFGTHLDFRLLGRPNELVEAKTSSVWSLWGADGTDEIPPDYWVQCQHEMAVTGAARCWLAVLLGNREFRMYPVDRDEGFITRLIAACTEFREQHLLADVPPIDGSEGAERYLRQLHPEEELDLKPATSAQTLLVERYRLAQQQEKEAKSDKSTVQQLIEAAIGTHEGLYGPGFRVTWKKAKDSTEINYPAIVDGLVQIVTAIPLGSRKRLPPGIRPFALDPQALIDLHTSTAQGTRRFHVTWTNKEGAPA